MRSNVFHFDNFAYKLRSLNYNDLPGIEAQLKMAPAIREANIRRMGAGIKAIPSSVLILFYPMPDGSAATIFMRRTDCGRAHSGQVSFPGGRYEQTDESLSNTAVREANEEIGISKDSVEIIAKLTDLFMPPSSFVVSPYLAVSEKRPLFFPNPLEVAELIEVRVSDLFESSNRRTEKIRLQEGILLETPCFYLNGNIVWGATAMILSEFLEYFGVKTNVPLL